MKLSVLRQPGRWRYAVAAVLILAAAATLQLLEFNPASSQAPRLRVREATSDPGLDPFDSAWDDAESVTLPLTAQNGLYFGGPGSVETTEVAALRHDDAILFRVEWQDSTADTGSDRVEDFADAVALEFPAEASSSVPSLCMGQADGGVNIWQWRAEMQAAADLEGGPPPAVYADQYPDTSDLYFPARAAGNPFAAEDPVPVQNLVSRAFGTLTHADVQDVAGHGEFQDGRWSVVFRRSFTGANSDLASFATSDQTDMAVAIWDGAQEDRDGKKSVSGFASLSLADVFASEDDEGDWPVVVAIAALVGVSLIGIGLGLYGLSQD